MGENYCENFKKRFVVLEGKVACSFHEWWVKWVLKENIKTKLRVFERKVLRKIYGPTKEKDGTWRIKSNEELNRLTGNKNIINYIKAQRLAWFGHVHRMPDNSIVKKMYMSGHPR